MDGWENRFSDMGNRIGKLPRSVAEKEEVSLSENLETAQLQLHPVPERPDINCLITVHETR